MQTTWECPACGEGVPLTAALKLAKDPAGKPITYSVSITDLDLTDAMAHAWTHQ